MIKINLLPWREELRQQQRRKVIANLLGSSFIAICVMILMHFLIGNLINSQKQRNDFLNQNIDKLNDAIGNLKAIELLQTKVTDNIKFLINLQSEHYQAVKVINEIALLTPKDIQLTAINHDNNNLTIYGKAQSTALITAFITKITTSPLFTKPNLTEIKVDSKESDIKLFTINMLLSHY